MNIRKATTIDLFDLSQLFDEYRVFYKKESNVQQGFSYLKERIEKSESVIYVALDESGKMGGFTQLYPVFSSTRLKRLWLLNDLYVNPNFRGLGFSKALIAEAKKLVVDTGACTLLLETEKTNVIGNNLYPSTGFKLDTEHNQYYWDNEGNFKG